MPLMSMPSAPACAMLLPETVALAKPTAKTPWSPTVAMSLSRTVSSPRLSPVASMPSPAMLVSKLPVIETLAKPLTVMPSPPLVATLTELFEIVALAALPAFRPPRMMPSPVTLARSLPEMVALTKRETRMPTSPVVSIELSATVTVPVSLPLARMPRLPVLAMLLPLTIIAV